jgi:DHA2 family multidrug resistance protein
MTAPIGWMSDRFGRKRLFIICCAGFTFASLLCASSQDIGAMVFARLLQGAFGAALVPLSQSVMLDAYPPEQRGQAMAIWVMGVVVGPIMGPTLGGYLTDFYNWRWVFYINLPFGILAIAALSFPYDTGRNATALDLMGFDARPRSWCRLMLDRGDSGLVRLDRNHRLCGVVWARFCLFLHCSPPKPH